MRIQLLLIRYPFLNLMLSITVMIIIRITFISIVYAEYPFDTWSSAYYIDNELDYGPSSSPNRPWLIYKVTQLRLQQARIDSFLKRQAENARILSENYSKEQLETSQADDKEFSLYRKEIDSDED